MIPSRSASTIKQFCEDHGISRGFYYTLEEAGLGPRVMRLGRRILISQEAAADWRRETEERTAAQAQARVAAHRADESRTQPAIGRTRVEQQPERRTLTARALGTTVDELTDGDLGRKPPACAMKHK